MSFATGFAKGMTDVLKRQQDIRDKKELLSWQYDLEDAMKHKSRVEKERAEDRKRVKTAESLAAEYNSPDALKNIYEMLARDEPLSHIHDVLSKNTFKAPEQPVEAETEAALGMTPETAEAPVETPEAPVGAMPAEAPVETPVGAPAAGGAGMNFLEALFGSGNREDYSRQNREKIAQMMGVSPEEVPNADSTYVNEEMAAMPRAVMAPKVAKISEYYKEDVDNLSALQGEVELRLQANPEDPELQNLAQLLPVLIERKRAEEGGLFNSGRLRTVIQITPEGDRKLRDILNVNGAWVYKSDSTPVNMAEIEQPTEDVFEFQRDMQMKMQPESNKLGERKSAAADILRYSDVALGIVKENGDGILADWGPRLTKVTQKLEAELKGISSLSPQDQVTELSNKAQSYFSTALDEKAEAKNRLDAIAVSLVYASLAADGQEGRSVSIPEFESRMATLYQNVYREGAFEAVLADFAMTKVQSIDAKVDHINNDNAFSRKYNASLNVTGTFEEYIKGEENLLRRLERFKSLYQKEPIVIEASGETAPSVSSRPFTSGGPLSKDLGTDSRFVPAVPKASPPAPVEGKPARPGGRGIPVRNAQEFIEKVKAGEITAGVTVVWPDSMTTIVTESDIQTALTSR